MGKAKKGKLKLPKRLMGVKVPKKTRKNLNGLLRGVPASQANPLVGAAIASLVTILAERLEQPLRDLIDSRLPGDKPRRADRPDRLPSQAHH